MTEDADCEFDKRFETFVETLVVSDVELWMLSDVEVVLLFAEGFPDLFESFLRKNKFDYIKQMMIFYYKTS